MSDGPDNMVLTLLRAIRDDVAAARADVIELRGRIGILEEQGAMISRRLDRVAGDIERIKRRLDLVDAP